MKALITLLIMTPVLATAAGGHGEHDGVPTAVIYQAINLIILFSGLIYYTKNGIKQFFIDRSATYLAAANKAAQAREEAEKQFEDLKQKIALLDSTYAESIQKAKESASKMKEQSLEETKALSKRIKDDAELTVRLEVERAQVQLKKQLLNDSIDAARAALSKDISSAEHEVLQNQFSKNIEAGQ
jgi:F-type H+-transporting ATPase subunit b